MFKRINDFYEVNTLGDVRRISSNKLITPSKNHNGYLKVTLSYNQKRYTKAVHRLVAETFIPNTENKPCVNHINGIKTDNRVDNLEWVTYSENNSHAFKNGLKSVNINSCKKNCQKACEKAKELQTWKIAQEYAFEKTRVYRSWVNYELDIIENKLTISEMARKYNLNPSGFSRVATGVRSQYHGWYIY